MTAADIRLCPLADMNDDDGDDGSIGLTVRSDPELLAQGWQRRHLVDPDRAAESIELYTSLGFDVQARKLTPADFGPDCGQCASTICRSYVLIYTRKKKDATR